MSRLCRHRAWWQSALDQKQASVISNSFLELLELNP